jgi:hypothetical protein
MNNITLTYQDQMNLNGTICSHPPKDNLKSIKLRDLLLNIGYFSIPSTTQNITIHYDDQHIQEAKNIINDPDISQPQREILSLLIKRT